MAAGNGNLDRAAELFHQARTVKPAERAAYLDDVCRADPALRAMLESLLAAHDRQGEFLAEPTADEAVDPNNELPVSGPDALEAQEHAHAFGEDMRHEVPGTMIGRYKLLQEIGRGGFGAVFMAEQREPVSRRVALKIIKLGMDTRSVIARFEAERQALAMMDHPNIARVLDAGATDAGRPYFVMELVKGVPVTAYSDKNQLGISDRLELFIDTCSAVQHAHTKGIIHRDLKPSNVLVTTVDGKPVPKVIDFGIAKATNPLPSPVGDGTTGGTGAVRLTDKTLFTDFRALIGTPAYMSPEQAELTGVDIDTRSDVYSLGVLLYELLTGTTPFDSRTLLDSGYDEMRRVIREVEPPTPSTRLSTLSSEPVNTHNGATPQEIAARRDVDVASLQRHLRGDLDWIVMKCLEKDRTRRYETTNSLALDVQRHLNGEPVIAAPPSRLYRLRKILRRYRIPVTIAAAFVLLILCGAVVSTVFWQRAEAQRARAVTIGAFMQEILSGAQSSVALGRDTALVKDLMDTAAQKIDDGAVKDDPEAEFHLRNAIGDAYRDILEFDAADRMLTPALDVARRMWPGDHGNVAIRLFRLAKLRADQGRLTESEALHMQSLQMQQRLAPEDDLGVAMCLAELAYVRQLLGRLAEAESIAIQSLEMCQRLFPGDHEQVALKLAALASVRTDQGRAAEAEPLYVQALAMSQRLHPENHRTVARCLNGLAHVRLKLGRPAEAVPLFEQELAMRQRLVTGDHPDTATCLCNLAIACDKAGRPAEAETFAVQSLEMRKRLFKVDDSSVAYSTFLLATFRQKASQHLKAEPLFREALGIRRRLLPPGHPELARSLGPYAMTLLALGNHAEAESLLRECLAIREKMLQPDSSEYWLVANTRSLLGQAVLAQAEAQLDADRGAALARLREAEPLVVDGYAWLSANVERINPALPLSVRAQKVREAGERLIRLYETWDVATPDQGHAEKAAEWRQRLEESDSVPDLSHPGPGP